MPIIYNFTGPFDISNWRQTPDTGTINTSDAPTRVTLISGNSGGGHNTSLTINIPFQGNVKFNWNSSTVDDKYFWDPFGYLLNGVFTKLTIDSDKLPESGTIELSLKSGDVFGFCEKTFDGTLGPSTTIISNFTFNYDLHCFKEGTKIYVKEI